MQQWEKLSQIVPEVNIQLDYLMPKTLSGLNIDDDIYINANNNYYKNVGVLAEEIGHYLTSWGDISDYSKINNMRQEVRARRKGAELVLPFDRIIEAYRHSMQTEHDICLYLEITPDVLRWIIADYKTRHGTYVDYNGYRITFEPLTVKELK